MAGSALYLYCVIPALVTPAALRAPALDGGTIRAVRHRDVAALAHACPPEPYQGGEEEVRGWVAAHNAVVEEAWAAAGSVLPMSFDVIVRDGGGRSAEANLTRWLGEHHAALRDRLRALDGRAEVGVQVLWGGDRVAAPEAEPAGPARGRAFFAREQRRRAAREQFEHKAAQDRRRYLEGLTMLADEVQVNRSRPVAGRHMVLSASLLLGKAMIPAVGSYLEDVRRQPGVEVRFTGPWPPYSFAGSFDELEAGSGDGEDSTGGGRPPVGQGGI